jgi:proprotein convertase subtilisin/kexin type 5
MACSDGFYLDTARKICLKCPINCLKCTSRSTCTHCVSGMNITLASGSCAPQCNSSSTTCGTILCHSTCLECFGTTENTCLSCLNASNLLQNYKCVTSCSTGYFAFDSSRCLPCNNSCLSCNNFEACT